MKRKPFNRYVVTLTLLVEHGCFYDRSAKCAERCVARLYRKPGTRVLSVTATLVGRLRGTKVRVVPVGRKGR